MPANITAVDHFSISTNPEDAINTKDDEAVKKLFTETGLRARHGKHSLTIKVILDDGDAMWQDAVVRYVYDLCLIEMPCVCTWVYQGERRAAKRMRGVIEGRYLGTIDGNNPGTESRLTFRRSTSL